MKFILGALAAASLLVGISATQPASAQGRCWWNGYTWHCRHFRHHGDWGWRHHHRSWGWEPGWYYR